MARPTPQPDEINRETKSRAPNPRVCFVEKSIFVSLLSELDFCKYVLFSLGGSSTFIFLIINKLTQEKPQASRAQTLLKKLTEGLCSELNTWRYWYR